MSPWTFRNHVRLEGRKDIKYSLLVLLKYKGWLQVASCKLQVWFPLTLILYKERQGMVPFSKKGYLHLCVRPYFDCYSNHGEGFHMD